MATSCKCLLVVLVIAALAQCVEPRSRPTNARTVRGPLSTARAAASAFVRLGRPQRLRRPRNCVSIHRVINGEASCNGRGCKLTCNPGYVFGNTPSKARILALRCDVSTGTLLVEGRRWSAGDTLCTPTECAAPCQNGGTCVAPNKCVCTGAHTGATCSEDIMVGGQPYKSYYPGPLEPNQRRVECEAGTRMPDGSTSVTLSYRDNSWFFPDGSMMIGAHQVDCVTDNTTAAAPASLLQRPRGSTQYQDVLRPETQFVPQSPCGAPCLNGGTCDPKGTCTCHPGYAGHKCEQKICRYPRFQNGINAVPLGTLQRLTFQCRPGYRSPRGDGGMRVVCVEGNWQLEDGRMLTQDSVKCTKRW